MTINYNELENFCRKNNFIHITDDILHHEQMEKNLIYTTSNNFIGTNLYPTDMPILININVWKKLVNLNNELKTHGKYIIIYDAYRPIEIQQQMWDIFYNIYGYNNETLVANPRKYGTHNITINAVDIFIANIDNTLIELPSEFDDFTGKANIYNNSCSEEAKNNRDLLIKLAKKQGLLVNEDEWWHFYD